MADLKITVDVTSLVDAKKKLTDFQNQMGKQNSVLGLARGVAYVEKNITNLVKAQQNQKISNRALNTGLSEQVKVLQAMGMSYSKATKKVEELVAAIKNETVAQRASAAAAQKAAAEKNLEGSILRQAQAIGTALNRLDQLNSLRSKGIAIAGQYQQAELEMARALARTNGYLTANGALNTQKALAEIRAAQASRDAAQASRADAQATQQAAQSYNQLIASINPTIAAQQRLSQSVKVIRDAQRAKVISTQEAIAALRQLRAAHDAASAAANRSARGFNRSGLIMQQTGYQVGDFLVQVQSGTNAFVAFGQQATQMAGLLTLSANPAMIALGTALAILIPLSTALGAALQRTNTDLSGITERFGRLEPVLSAIGSAFSGAGTVFINSINLVINNLETFTTLIASLGAAVLFKYAGGAAFAASVTASLSAALALVQLNGIGASAAIIAQTIAANAATAAVTLLNAAWARFLLIAPQLAVFVGVFAGIQLAMRAFVGEAKDLKEIDIRDIFAGTDAVSNNLGRLKNQVGLLGTSQETLNDRVELYRKLSASSTAEALGFTSAVRSALEQEIEARRALIELERISLQQNRIVAENARTASRERISEIEQQISAQEELLRNDTLNQFTEEYTKKLEKLRTQLSAMGLSYDRQSAELRLIDATLALIDTNLQGIVEESKKDEESAKNRLKLSRQIAEQELKTHQQALERRRGSESEIRVLQLALKYGRDSVEVQRELNLQARARLVTEMMLQGQSPKQIIAALSLIRQQQELTQRIENSENSAKGLADALKDASSAMADLLGFSAGLDKALAVAAAKVGALRKGANAAVAGQIAGMRVDLDARMGKAVGAGVDLGIVERMFGGERARISQLEALENEGAALQASQRGGAEEVDPLVQLQEQIRLEEELLGKTEAQRRVIQALGIDWKKYGNATIDSLIASIEEMDRFNEKVAEQQQIADTIKDSMSEAFMSMVDGTKSAKDAFRDMARAVIKQLYDILVVQQLVGSFDAKSKTGSGIVGAIMGALTGSKASGGSMMANRPYLVGERGPELVIPGRSATVTNADLTRKSMGGSDGLVVNNNITVNGGNDPAAIRMEVAKLMPQITNATKTAVIDARRRGGQMRAAFQ